MSPVSMTSCAAAAKPWTLWCRKCLLALALSLTIFPAGPARCADLPPNLADKYFFESWPVVGDVEMNAVTAICQTHDGYLWLATYSGLVRFDGVRFVIFTTQNTKGLRNNRLTSLYEDKTGVLWIGHETGELTRMVNGAFAPFEMGFKWVGGPIWGIAADEKENLWLASRFGGIFRLRDGRCSLMDLPSKGWPAFVTRDSAGSVWLVSNGAAGRLVDGDYNPLESDASEGGNNYERLLPSRQGGIWIIRDQQIGKWNEDRWQVPLRPVPWPGDFSTCLLETSTGDLLVGTMKHGLQLFQPDGASAQLGREQGLASPYVRCLCEDHEGNVWVGTSHGVSALRSRKIRMLSPPDEWLGAKVLSFAVLQDGTAWVGTQGAGLYRYSGGDWTRFAEAQGLQDCFIWSVLQLNPSELMIGTWGGGLTKFKQGRFFPQEEFNRFRVPSLALFRSTDGQVWVGTSIGVCKWREGKCDWVLGKEELQIPDVRAICELPDHSMCFGMFGGGLAIQKAKHLVRYTRNELGSDFAVALLPDQDGTLWIGTTDNGLSLRKDGHFQKITPAQGLPAAISHIVDDQLGNLWFGSQSGICRVSKQELRACMAGSIKTLNPISFGRSEGLASKSCPGGFTPGACRAADGTLWFPTSKGIAVVDPAHTVVNRVPPPVVIEKFVVENEPIAGFSSGLRNPAAARLTIPAGKRRFEIFYTGLSFAAPDRVRFQYKLEGLENDWIEAGTRRVVDYSYLQPREYRFRVRACNNDGVWNETGASLAFAVQPFLWQTLWFQGASFALGGICITSGVLWLSRRRIRRKLEELSRQRALEQERARIARDIHDDLGASLTRITMLAQTMRSDLPKGSPGALAAEKVSSTARDLTLAMDEIVWAVNPKHDSLESVASYLGGYAQDAVNAAGIRCRLNLPLVAPPCSLNVEIRHNLFLAFKEALNNAIKHAGASEITIGLAVAQDEVTLELADNGCGFSPGLHTAEHEGSLPPAVRPSSGGNGLPNIRKRMDEIGGTVRWVSAPGHGTKVVFTVPACHRNNRQSGRSLLAHN